MRLNVFYDQHFHCADINIIPLTDLGNGETFLLYETDTVVLFSSLFSCMLHIINCLLHHNGSIGDFGKVFFPFLCVG